jgi:hypothetical protein
MDRSCPLGHTCDACLWHVKTVKEHLQTGEVDVVQQCALVALVEHATEQGRQLYSLGGAVESQRNVTAAAADKLAGALATQRLKQL